MHRKLPSLALAAVLALGYIGASAPPAKAISCWGAPFVATDTSSQGHNPWTIGRGVDTACAASVSLGGVSQAGTVMRVVMDGYFGLYREGPDLAGIEGGLRGGIEQTYPAEYCETPSAARRFL